MLRSRRPPLTSPRCMHTLALPQLIRALHSIHFDALCTRAFVPSPDLNMFNEEPKLTALRARTFHLSQLAGPGLLSCREGCSQSTQLT
jgi:hypothetical protein